MDAGGAGSEPRGGNHDAATGAAKVYIVAARAEIRTLFSKWEQTRKPSRKCNTGGYAVPLIRFRQGEIGEDGTNSLFFSPAQTRMDQGGQGVNRSIFS